MTFRSQNVAMLRAILKRIVGEPARTGKFNTDGTIDPNPMVDDNPNVLWVRVRGNRGAIPAKNSGRMVVNSSYTDVPVRVAYNSANELEIMSGDATEVDKLLGGAAGTILTAQLINEVARFIVTGRNMLPARARVWNAGTLTVNSEIWVYRDTANDRRTWIPTDANSLDLTGSLPAQVAGIDQKAPAIIALDATAAAPTLVVLVGSSIDVTSDLTVDLYDTIFVPDDHYPLAGVALRTGMTTLADSDFIDVREWLDRGVGLAGAPADATYIVQAADGDLPNAQALDILITGLMKNTTATGIVSIAVAGTDYTSPTGTENLTNKTISASSANLVNLALATATTLTIASGVVTKTKAWHKIAPQSGTADDLDTISGGLDGELMIIRPTSGNTITVTTAGNIYTPDGNPIVLDQTYTVIWLIFDSSLGAGGKWVVIGISASAGGGSMTSFNVAGDSGTPQAITDGQTLTVVGGTGIDTVAGATRLLTINIDSTVVTLTGSQTLTNKTLTTPTIASFVNATHNHTNAAGGGALTSAAISDFTEAAQDALDAALVATAPITKSYNDGANTETIALNVAGLTEDVSPDSANDMLLEYDDSAAGYKKLRLSTLLAGVFSFLLGADSGSAQTIGAGDTLTVAGGTGIDTVVSATDTVTINIDSTVVTLTGSQTLTNKTLTTPVIASFVNATHNHTNAAGGGTLTSAAVSDFTEAAQDAMDAALVATVPITKTYNDGANTETLALDVPGLTEDTTPDSAADMLLEYDASASGYKKLKLQTILDMIGGGSGVDVQVFTPGTSTWTKPADAEYCVIHVLGSGGGGGSGRKGAAGGARGGGGAGGTAGYSFLECLEAALGATENIFVSAGGSGAAAQTTNSTNGSAGSTGGDSYVGASVAAAKIRATGGTGGNGGGAGGGATPAGTAGSGSDPGVAGGTGSGGPSNANTAPSSAYSGGGGGGGGISAGNITAAAASSGAPTAQIGATPPAPGFPGANGNNGAAGIGFPVRVGGAGGSASLSGAGGAGGNGGYGAGGGGGAAGVDSVGNSGAGGNGGDGIVVIITYLSGGGGGGTVASVVAGTDIAVDNSDPANPIVSATNSRDDKLTWLMS